MCGRFTLTSDIKELREHFSAINTITFDSSYNISPSREIPVVRQANGNNEIHLCQWGLVPYWSKAGSHYKTINARSETLADKASFREAYKKRRCLIPATGFYEWKPYSGGKQAYYFQLKNKLLFAFAGIWDLWQGKDESIESCAIITTRANTTVAPVHDRMPVILERESYSEWLKTGEVNLLVPFPGEMECHPVSHAVNNPRNDGRELIKPVESAVRFT